MEVRADRLGWAAVRPVRRPSARARRDVRRGASPGERVLDVGCGDGEVSALIAARLQTGAVRGIDPSPLMVAQAAGRADAKVHFEAGDVLALDLGGRNIDLVVSLNGLHWVPDLGRALSELRSVTAPAGRLVLQFVGASERRSLEQMAMDVAGSPGGTQTSTGSMPPSCAPHRARSSGSPRPPDSAQPTPTSASTASTSPIGRASNAGARSGSVGLRLALHLQPAPGRTRPGIMGS
ncbi:class I SAM-dependent methyltransferase [Subtercola boreus]|uniref:class I SAM-dependent methyltransferase n=1 Tax=Subtercola boreus TaxID=120213 RepID=UPI00263BC46D|nr:class I SAM-dependent methyltransferase [Subtercola boreus]